METPINQIGKVEQQNNLAINVFGYEKIAIVPYRISKHSGDKKRINLFFNFEEGVSSTGDVGIRYHYSTIVYLNRLLHDQTKYHGRKHLCERYLQGYCREDLLQRHIPECKGIGDTAVRIEMPETGKNDVLKL